MQAHFKALLALVLLSGCQVGIVSLPRQTLTTGNRIDLGSHSRRGLALRLHGPDGFTVAYTLASVSKLRLWLVYANSGALTPVSGPFGQRLKCRALADESRIVNDRKCKSRTKLLSSGMCSLVVALLD